MPLRISMRSRCVRTAFALTLMSVAVLAPRSARSELVLHVDFESASNLPRDVSGNGADGTIVSIGTGAGVLSQTGDAAVGSGAGLFNPTDSGTSGLAIEFPDALLPNLEGSDNFAISYWVKPTTAYLNFDPLHAMFSSVATGADASLGFQIDNKGNTTDGQVGVARLSGQGFEAPLIDSSTNLIPGVWQNIALVSNGQSGRVQVYLDGALTQDLDSVQVLGSRTGLALNEVYVGMSRGRNRLFQGLLDDVRVYDTAATSEVLDLSGSSLPRLEVNRDTGEVSIAVPASGTTQQITSYTITSAGAVLDSSAWTPVDGGTGDAGSLSETFAAAEITPGNPLSLGAVWEQGPFEDLYATAVLGDGSTTITLPVAFVGNGGDAFLLGDMFMTGDGLDLSDWQQFKSGQGADLTSISTIDAYRMGDLDGDGDNDGIDFFLFKEAFDAANFDGAFVQMLTIPEPGSMALAAFAGVALLARRRGPPAVLLCGIALLAFSAAPARAQLLVYDGFDTGTIPDSTRLGGTLGGETSFGWDGSLWTDSIDATLQDFVSIGEGLTDFPGLRSAPGYATRPARNNRTAINRQIGASELQTLTADGGSFWFSVVMANRTPADDDDESVFLFTESPIIDWRDIDFAEGFVNGQPVPSFRSLGIMFDDGDPSGRLGTTAAPGGGGDGIYAVYTDGSGANAVYSEGFAIGDANEPHLVIGNVTWGTDGGSHQYDLYAIGIEDIADPLAPLQLPSTPFGSLTIPAADIAPSALNTIGLAGGKLPAYDEIRFGLSVADVLPSVDRLTLEVDVATGVVTLKNDSTSVFEIDYLEISSAAGSLDPAEWVSLSDNASFPTGSGDGSGWEEGGNTDSTQLIESFLLGATTIAPSDEIVLGQAFQANAPQDLRLAYHLATAGATIDGGFVTYTGGLLGDYNGDGAVDAADYTVWRDTEGLAVFPGSGADGDNDGDIDADDLGIWRDNYGRSVATGVATPEPVSATLLAISLFTLAVRRSGEQLTC